MCRTIAYKTQTCQHRWLTIIKRCSPGFGFTNTPIHEFKSDTHLLTGSPKYQFAPAGTCPICDKKSQYDGNTTRLIADSGSSCCGPQNTVLANPMMMVGPYTGGPGLGFPENYHRLSPLQKQYVANEQAKELARMQFYPHNPEKYMYAYKGGSSGCTIM